MKHLTNNTNATLPSLRPPTRSILIGLATLASILPLVGCDSADNALEGERLKPITAPADEPNMPEKSSESPNPSKVNDLVTEETAKGQRPEAARATSQEPSALPLVKRLVIASDVLDREPVEMNEGRVKEPVVAFIELQNTHKHSSNIVVTFEHESGRKVGFIELSVPSDSQRFRTWGRTRNIQHPGAWTAIVSSASGEELARTSFTIVG